jgi:uncharacterized protein (TIGR02588 family)
LADEKPRTDGTAQAPLLEWIAAGIGLLLTLMVLAVIGREALNGESEQLPVISVSATGISPAGSGHVLAFEATNKTGGTAAAVEIEVTLKAGDTIVETGKATLDYVPGHSKAKGGVFFLKDPRRHKLELRALGFQTP